ncbi:MAG: flagellar basal body P-ring formation protein FlgA [Candidatus Marinimicrobia bacterium]|nr:flagellar basal body P-ring formation protein FlgA [Candidatus Neomarinimicrobiota bacterium]
MISARTAPSSIIMAARLGLLALALAIPSGLLSGGSSREAFNSRLEAALRDHVTGGLRHANLSGEVAAVQLPANLGVYPSDAGIRPLRSFLPDKAAGRYIIPMEISPPGVRPVRIYATVETVALVYGWEAQLPLKRGDSLDPKLFKRTTARVHRRERDYYTAASLPEGYQICARLAPGELLRYHHIEEAPAVKRGEKVTIYYQRNNITLISPGKARRRGQIGDIIPVIAAVTGKRLYGRLTAPGIIVVE